ncbi:fatty acyl-AMP ligase [Actinocrispum wychmicini]|uniref:Fatty-acyl-CoA synthase n=1 Tax=Actinocrispum wychmicini TaxID=1213861 RepID=A0A4V2S733_9PSEU|nr:fatty acyl-AMP ligase [Actinocrispum wychmicini]TCO58410.1 fatty-acyl-CoA synthase [Actinocrispum wychmicini]
MSRFVDVLLATARTSDKGIILGEPGSPARRTWAQVHEQAQVMAGGLVDGGLAPRSAVAILAADPALIAPAIQAVWLSGGSVTMLHQPTPRTDLAVWAEDTLRVLSMIDSKLVLLGSPFDQLAPVLTEHGIPYRLLSELSGTFTEPVVVSENDHALLQLTSGSTADPKAVRITHGNLFSNIMAMADRAALDVVNDTMVSWLPLFHDMGMVGFLTVPMTLGIELVKVTPPDFLRAPLLWMDLISRYRATITAAPNFAYAMVGRRMGNAADGDYDLSTLRLALNGAEPIDADAVKAFTDAGARFNMPAECVFPAYGMAECTLAVSFAPLFTGLTLDYIDAHALEVDRRAVPVPPGDGVRSFAVLGKPLPDVEASVVAETGAVLGDREVGEIRLRGAAITPGYFTVDGPRSLQDEDGWMPTGDIGYTIDGDIVVCGRNKDVIILAGRNIYPTDIERAAVAVDGVRAGNAVAVRIDAGTRRERFAVVCESKVAGDPAEAARIRREVASRVFEAVEARPVAVIVLAPGTLPKTPSGKLRRAAAGEQLRDSIRKSESTD